jgi:hypothetical protein
MPDGFAAVLATIAGGLVGVLFPGAGAQGKPAADRDGAQRPQG